MFMNQFAVFSDHTVVHVPTVVPVRGLTTLEFPSFSGVTKDLVGPKWCRIRQLKADFQEMFPGFDFTVEYDGNSFLFVMASIPEQIGFISNTFGIEVSIANDPIQTDPKYAGAVIGKGGKGLRDIEDSLNNACLIYHDDGAFYVKFNCDMSTSERVSCMSEVKQSIFGRARFLEMRLSDAESVQSESTASTFSMASSISTCSDESQLSQLFAGDSPTPSEAAELVSSA